MKEKKRKAKESNFFYIQIKKKFNRISGKIISQVSRTTLLIIHYIGIIYLLKD